ncbi:hypothetical protein J6590_011607 [Homalodisca vitripennis]|nr:hypothetical protein J6590_011607 [Homalodisca vitripennis]
MEMSKLSAIEAYVSVGRQFLFYLSGDGLVYPGTGKISTLPIPEDVVVTRSHSMRFHLPLLHATLTGTYPTDLGREPIALKRDTVPDRTESEINSLPKSGT